MINIDFLPSEFAGLVGGSLQQIHPSAHVPNVLLQNSQWFKPDDIDSSGGVYFEYMIVSAIVSCARNITNQSLN